MKRFNTIDELHAYIENAAKHTIKHYYSDWKNYDRPKMMIATGNKEKEVYIIFRDCGSYFYTLNDLTDTNRELPAYIMEYYKQDASANYYKVDFENLKVIKIVAGLPQRIKDARKNA